jgi:hypothetical protein
LFIYTLNVECGEHVQVCGWVSSVKVLETQGADILGHDELDDEKVSADHTAESE